MRILIVEDEYVTALALRMELREAGYEIVGVAAGEREAVDCFRRQRPDFAIVDIHLSQGNGVSAAEKLGSIPVLFVTPDSKALNDLTRKASAVLLKPFGPKRLWTRSARLRIWRQANRSRPICRLGFGSSVEAGGYCRSHRAIKKSSDILPGPSTRTAKRIVAQNIWAVSQALGKTNS